MQTSKKCDFYITKKTKIQAFKQCRKLNLWKKINIYILCNSFMLAATKHSIIEFPKANLSIQSLRNYITMNILIKIKSNRRFPYLTNRNTLAGLLITYAKYNNRKQNLKSIYSRKFCSVA